MKNNSLNIYLRNREKPILFLISNFERLILMNSHSSRSRFQINNEPEFDERHFG